MPPRIFITAFEASGDQHAAELIRSLNEIDPTLEVEGLGGAKMSAAGAKIHQETVGRAAMGWRGALRALEALRWLKWTQNFYEQSRPDLHICVDSSAINLPFAKLAKRLGIPVMYYIAPQLWASREGRIKKIRAYVDKLACIFPFEEPYFRRHGVDAHYVGHPLFDEITRTPPREPRFPDAPPVIGIIPGSRRSEVKANLPNLLDVASRIRVEFPEAEFSIPSTPAVHDLVQTVVRGTGFQVVQGAQHGLQTRATGIEIVENGFDELIPACDLCLCKSGTSTLHVAAHNVPMIVVYRINPLIWHLAGRWLIKTKKIAMVNILAGQTDLVPEFVPWYGSNDAVAECALDFLRHPEKLQQQRKKLQDLIRTLDRPGASMNAAKLAIDLMTSAASTRTHHP